MKGLRKKVTSILLAATLSFGMLSGTGLNVYADETSTEETIEQQDVETATEETADDTVVVVTEEAVEETAVESVEASDEAEASEKSTEDTEAAIASDEEIEAVSEEVAEEATEETVEESEDASEVIEEAEESEEAVSPAFSDEEIIDDVTIKVSAPEGVFPEGAYLSVSSVSESEKTFAEDAVSAKRAADTNVADSYTFDIKVLDSDGNELQPEDGNLVKVSFSMDEVSNENLDAIIYHIPDDGIADQLYTNVEGDTVSAMSDGFSLYTVEFSYGTLEYVLNGDESVALSEILTAVGLSGEVTNAVSSSPELFSVTNESGEWMVNSLQAFDTNETLTVTIDGVDYVIDVTDDPAEEYNIWIGSTQITNANCSDVLGDGTVSFDKGTNTLTFNNFVYDYDTMGYFHFYNDNAVTIARSGVTIKGTATINLNKNGYGIFSYTTGTNILNLEDANLTVSGYSGAIRAGELNITSGTYNLESAYNAAISFVQAMNMSGGTVHAKGSVSGIYASNGTLTVSGGILDCANTWPVSDEGYGAYYAAIIVSRLNVYGGTVEAKGIKGCKAIGSDAAIHFAEDIDYLLNEQAHKIIGTNENATYDLYVKGVQVTVLNKDDVLGDGKVKFELTSAGHGKLTLDDLTLSGDYGTDGIIYFGNLNLTIVGSADLTNTNGPAINGHYVSGQTYSGLVLNGDFDCTGSKTAISSYGGLEVPDGTVKAKTTGNYTAISTYGEIKLGESRALLKPEGGSIKKIDGINCICENDGTTKAKEVEIGLDVITYDIWIGSTQITNANCSDVFGDGTVSYNNSAKALTFNNFVYDYDTMGYHHFDNNDNAITIGVDGVRILGTAEIIANENISGIFTSGNDELYLKADKLTIGVGVAAIHTGELYIFFGTYDLTSYNNYAINAKLVTMGESSSLETVVNATGAAYGIYVPDGTVNVSGGTLNCKNTWNVSEPNYGPYYAAIQSKTLIVTGGSVEALGENGCKAIKAETINIGSGMGYTINEDTHKKIEKVSNTTYNLWVGKTQVTSANKDNILNELDAEGNPTATFDPDTNTLTLCNPTINSSYMGGLIYAQQDLTVKGKADLFISNVANYGIYTTANYDLIVDGSFTITGYSNFGNYGLYGKNVTVKGDSLRAEKFYFAAYATEKFTFNGGTFISYESGGIYAKNEVSVVGDVDITSNNTYGIHSEGNISLDGKVKIRVEDENGCGIRSEKGNITVTGDTDIEAGNNGIYVEDNDDTGEKGITLSGEKIKIVSNSQNAVFSCGYISINGNINATGNNYAIYGTKGITITGNVEAYSKNFEAIGSTKDSIIIDGDVTAKTESSNNGAMYAYENIEIKSGKWTLDGSEGSGAINAGDGYKIIIPDTHEIREPAGGKLSSGGNNILNEDSTRAAHVVITRKKGVITFDVNGGLLDGAPTFTVEAEVGDTITIPTSVPVRDGYTFTYWKGSEYYPGDTYTVTGDHTLTAQWEVDSTKGSSSGSGTSGGTQNVTTTTNTPVNLTTTDDSSNNGTNNSVTTADDTKKDTTNADVDTKKDTTATDVNTKKDSSVTTSGGSSDAKAPAATVTTGDSTPSGTKNLTTNQKSGPATGDNTSMFLLLSLMAISLLGMITIVRSKKSKA